MDRSFANSIVLVVAAAAIIILLPPESFVAAKGKCNDCGSIPVPYPLSTGPDCGERDYELRCTDGTLWLDAFNDTSRVIKSVDPSSQRLIIRLPEVPKDRCVSPDLNTSAGTFRLKPKVPFNITSANSILMYNCTDGWMLQASFRCSSTNPCHTYLKGSNALAACGATELCCYYKPGGSFMDTRLVGIGNGYCKAYTSFINLDHTLPVSRWPEPGVELMWDSPREPACKLQEDCRDLPFSNCSRDPAGGGGRRCLCNADYAWDPTNGVCRDVKCDGKKNCTERDTRTPLIAALGVTVSITLLGALIGIACYIKYQRAQLELRESMIKLQQDLLSASVSGKSARIISLKVIEKATNNFSKDNLLGSGGFGEVFKGTLDDGTHLAVKRAKLDNIKGTDQILNEVRILCQVNHRNLVRLLGCCIESQQPIMIHEYISNGTLFDHLHGHFCDKVSPLTWHRRLIIAHQMADGLAYLHFSAVPPIYHRDIKSSNILLDENLDAKVSDFGLSRLVDTNKTHISTCVQGTLGYLDPGYYLSYQVTDKSDVYSFGVVLFEILTSKKVIDFNRQDADVNLAVYMKQMEKEEKMMDTIDPLLKVQATNVELETMKALGRLAMLCLDDKRQNRPTMKEVAEEIEYNIGIVAGSSEVIEDSP